MSSRVRNQVNRNQVNQNARQLGLLDASDCNSNIQWPQRRSRAGRKSARGAAMALDLGVTLNRRQETRL